MIDLKDIKRIFKGLFTAKNISDDEITTGISFIVLIILGFLLFFVLYLNGLL